MRIVYVLTSIGVGGAERQVINLASRMAQRGHTVALLVLRPRLAEEWHTDLPVTSLEVRKTPVSVLVGMVRGRLFLAEFRPDLVHSHGFHANITARLLKLLAPTLVVVSTVHNVYEGGWRRMLAYRLTDALSRRTTAVSEAAANRFTGLKAVSKRKCVVVQNAFNLEKLVPQPGGREQIRAQLAAEEPPHHLPADQSFVWLAVGRIVPAKDYPNLLRAFALVLAERPEARLWIAGQFPSALPASLSNLASELGVGSAVRWLGLRRDIPELLDAADAFVQASAWEGMPLAIGEAMAMAKAVVATDVGGVRELLGSAGVLVPPGDSEALADSMLAVMRTPKDELRTLGAAARLRIEREFNMDARIVDWEKLYAELAR